MTKRSLAFLTMLAAMVVLAAACGTTTADETSTEDSVNTEVAGTSEADELDTESDEAASTASPEPVDTPESSTADAAQAPAPLQGAGADSASTADPDGRLGALLFADTLNSPDAPTSLRFEGVLSMTGAPGSETPGTFALRIDGALDLETEAMHTTVDFGELAGLAEAAAGDLGPDGPSMAELFEDPMEVIVIGERGWIRWGLLAFFLGENVWVEMEADDVGTATDDFGAFGTTGDPTDMLDQLADAAATVEQVGVETINGVETKHWRALVDLEQLAAGASPDERADLEEQFGSLDQPQFPIDVWIGVEGGLVHRYRVDVPPETLGAGENEIELSTASVQFDFFDYGADVAIVAPPADEIRSGDELFGSLAD